MTDPSEHIPDTQSAASLLSTGDVFSGAYNFMSSISAGVDPRTGMFSASITLPTGAANDLRGPISQLRLGYSPLMTEDQGFGLGWMLGTTSWDGASQQLQLNSGERFRGEIVGQSMRFPDVRLPVVTVTVQRQEMWVRHNDGTSERLIPLAGHPSLWVVSTLVGADGSALSFDWRSIGNAAYLQKVSDAQGRTVVALAYEGQQTHLTLQPDTPSQMVMTFQRISGQLRRVTVDGLPDNGWQFDYSTASSGLLLLSKCTQPTGSTEEVTYSEANGLYLPAGAPFPRMPVVSQTRKDPGDGQPVQLVRYDYGLYGSNNYFGWPVVRQWRNREDNLYHLTGGGDFLYGSTETLMDARGTTLQTISRTFNRFHLLTRERTLQGQTMQETQTTYYDEPWLPIARQVPYFQFPHKVITRKAHLDGQRVLRELGTEEETRYDELGNPVWHRNALGGIEASEYYPVSGETDHCPADPLGRITRLKSRTASPPPGTEGPVKQTRYLYQSLPVRQDAPAFALPTFVQSSEERLLLVEGENLTELVHSSQTFIVDPASPHHARLLSETETVQGKSTTRVYSYTLTQATNARSLERAVLQENVTVTGHDGHSSVSQSSQDLYSGLMVTEQTDEQMRIAFAHDALGRVVQEVAAPNSAFEAAVNWAYSLSANERCQTRIGASGRKETVWLDGMGREIRREKQTDSGQTYTAWTGEYDVLGRVFREISCDPGNEDTPALSLTTERTFDDWGNVLTETSADGVTQHTLADPVALIGTSWQTDANGVAGAKTVTTHTLDGRPLKEELYCADGVLQHEQSWSYDGLGRCISQSDSMGRETLQEWDVRDRLVSTTLPDGSVIKRTYAEGHDGELPATVSITHASLGSHEVVLGERQYDGLGRLVWEKVGQSVSEWQYAEGQIHAHTQTLPDGTQVLTERQPELGGALLSMQAPGISVFNKYDPLSGRLLESQGNLGQQNDHWSPSGLLTKADYAWQGDQPRSQQQTTTPSGKVTRLTDADGAEQRCQYDGFGRLSQQQGPDVTVTVTYDAASRIHQQRTQSRDGSRDMTVALGYDSLGRPARRTTDTRTPSGQQVEVQTQQWRQDGKLTQRELSRDGVLVRSETFDYDIRGRMIAHRLTGPSLPEDAHGKPYRQQHFQYDALDNVRRLETVFADGSANNVSVFGYNPSDLTQLISISHSRPDYPAPVTLEYDALGNLKRDERGNPLHYDALGRLIGVTLPTGQRRWHYGPGGNIIKTEDAGGPRWRYHTGGHLSCEVGESTQTRWVRAGNVPVAESRLASAVREVMLLGTDAQGSVTTEAKDQIQTPVYGAYGQSTTGASRLGYAGALREQDTGWYFLGDYRIYNPVLMRFHSRDSLSPFGEGGLNGYAYCAGDPVNRIDPSGHAWTDWLLPAAGLVLGMIGTVASLGALAAPAAALTASYMVAVTTATLSVVSLAADVASIVLLTSGNENAGRILGYVGMATGLASAAPSIASAAAKNVKAFGMRVGRGQYKLQHAGGVPGGGRAFPGRAQRVGAEMPPMRNTDFSMMLEQTPIRESFLPHLSRGDLQNIGQTNSANMASVYREGTSTAPVPLELPFRGTSGLVNGQIQEFGYPVIANPHYVNEVRQTISGTHPKYYPWQIGEAGIENPSQLRIIDRPVFEDYAAQRLAGDEPFRWGLMSFDSDFRWFSQRGEIAHRGWNCRIL
ncbi:RHS repeat-associated core domain-containing protein [Pseudomonas sp. TWR2-1-1]|uniref:RHS repeat domain-containing protein n=1 Tax=Pseudomonas sp. TWR2-1-1 TaxID=2804610 RepID=UPI003CF5917C